MNFVLDKIFANSSDPNKKSILLIDFNSLAEKNSSYYFYSKFEKKSFALGIVRIYEYLLKKEVNVRLVHFSEIIGANVDKTLIPNYDVIGVNALSNMAYESYKFCIKIKTKYPEKIIIGGGEHYALDYDWILNNKSKTGCDICCTFQGELPMLAIAKNMKLNDVGSIAFMELDSLIINQKYPVLSDESKCELLKPVPIINYSLINSGVAFPEFSSVFNSMGLTQTGSGCIYSCDFCTNCNFMGIGFNNTLRTAISEIKHLQEKKIPFFFVNNALLNANIKDFHDFLIEMIKINTKSTIKWAAFMSVSRSKNLQEFKKMNEAGCLMINVGIEDMLGDRKKLKKGEDINSVITFINDAKKFLLVRALLILGLPNHYHYSREELKNGFLNFMKENPMAIYRINFFTPIVGTKYFSVFENTLIDNFRENIEFLNKFDTMHSVVDPIKMYEKLNIPNNKRWMNNAQDWVYLQNEIMNEYLNSPEHTDFLDSLKSNEHFSKIALNYKSIILNNEIIWEN